MLDEENEETKEKDREKRREAMLNNQQLRDTKLCRHLFGDIGLCVEYNLMCNLHVIFSTC